VARAFIPPQWRDLTGGAEEVVVAGKTVRAVIAALDRKHPGLARRLMPRGTLAPGIAVAVDGVVAPTGLLAPVGPHSEVHFLPAIGGG
jgi:molybdopterin synthase sulfur carrier subunit